MNNVKSNTIINTKQQMWFTNPRLEHLVQFYPYETILMASLEEYIRAGIKGGDTCIVIASQEHLKYLDERLARNNIDTARARKNGQYINLDAAKTLEKFMINGLPDWSSFLDSVGSIVEVTYNNGRPIRAFGEMVALLWQKGNAEAVLQLEEYWNDLAKIYPFSLFCAYPMLHFDRSIHGEQLNKINKRHSVVTPCFKPRLSSDY
ncbi:hypothetical protein BH23PAT1_BH23PAT1_0180 [soil metagenome]